MRTTKITSRLKRMILGGWRQRTNTPLCPREPDLDGKVVVITGGTRGIGLETVKGLAKRNGRVIILARNREDGEFIVNHYDGDISFIQLDLSDINSIIKGVYELKLLLGNREVDIVINNAGVVTKGGHKLSPQGFELTFATNILGHHILFREIVANNLLKQNGHIISITGDIYIQADGCTPDYKYRGKMGMQA